MKGIDEAAQNAKLFIVDDNPTNVLLLERILKDSGYANIHSTTDSREVAQRHKEEGFDLILLDIRMPHMDGFEVMEALAQDIDEDYLPVLVLTAQTDLETRHRALQLGAKDFVTKPFDRTEVLNRIRNLLEVRILFKQQKSQNEILESAVRQRTEELYKTQLEIVRRLGRAGEFRDNETGMHVIRMSKGAQLLALAAGLDADHAERILYAAPMHDIGKIGIPDRILLKPGKLDADEWRVMKTHVTIGADILADHPSELMQMARTIVLYHHEKWDGSGYPRGIEGEAIPIEGRVAAITDVFDALTSERPYKDPWPVERAVNLLKEEAGKHFDPELVGLFVDILPEILKIRDEYADSEEDLEQLAEYTKLVLAGDDEAEA